MYQGEETFNAGAIQIPYPFGITFPALCDLSLEDAVDAVLEGCCCPGAKFAVDQVIGWLATRHVEEHCQDSSHSVVIIGDP